jgi:hypothetical protein
VARAAVLLGDAQAAQLELQQAGAGAAAGQQAGGEDGAVSVSVEAGGP